MTDRVSERRRAAQLARHYRDQEGLTIAEIARRLGRAESTVKAYLYDPLGQGPRGQGALSGRLPGLRRADQRAQRQGRRVCLLQLRREAPCCIPGAAGRNSKGCSWVQ
jgi:AraC-like DNA-binding protein